MRKTITIFMIIMVLAVSPMHMFANSISELEEKQNQVEQELQENRAELQRIQAEKQITVAEVNALNEEIRIVSDQLMEIEVELEYTEELLAITEEELIEAELARDHQYTLFKDRAKYMYMYGKSSYLDVILNAESLTDLIKRVDSINRIISYDQGMVEELLAAEEAVALKVAETEKQKADLEILQEEFNEIKLAYEISVEEKNVMIQRLSVDEEERLKMIEQAEQNEEEIKAQIRRAQEEQARRAAANNVVHTYSYDGGQLQWPVPGHSRVSSGYVGRRSPISGRNEFHTGIDIPAPTGTNVVAAEDGVVIFSGWQNGFGNTIMIDHGSGLVTLYGHNSSLVARVGQRVSRGDLIARVGSTGWSTGPHLHFEVRVNGNHTDPNPFLR